MIAWGRSTFSVAKARVLRDSIERIAIGYAFDNECNKKIR